MTQTLIFVHTWPLLGHTLNKVTTFQLRNELCGASAILNTQYYRAKFSNVMHIFSFIDLRNDMTVTLSLCLPSTNIWPVGGLI